MNKFYALIIVNIAPNQFRGIAMPFVAESNGVKEEVLWDSEAGQRPTLIEQATKDLGEAPAKIVDRTANQVGRILSLADAAKPVAEPTISLTSPEEEVMNKLSVITGEWSDSKLSAIDGVAAVISALSSYQVSKTSTVPTAVKAPTINAPAGKSHITAEYDTFGASVAKAYQATANDSQTRRLRYKVGFNMGLAQVGRSARFTDVTPDSRDLAWFQNYVAKQARKAG